MTDNYDFTGVSEEETQVEGGSGGGFTDTPAEPGVALFRLREVLEFGKVMGEYNGKPKESQPVSLVFELVHPRHAINKDDGSFVRNHEVTVRLNKSFNEKAKYFKLFNKLNHDGSALVQDGKTPSFLSFIGKAFYGAIHHNLSKDGKKTYVNLDKDGEYTIGAPQIPEIDQQLQTPTGNYTQIPVPEMSGSQRVFLWETGVNDAMYRKMWESIAIVGEKKDGTPFKNWIQEQISDSAVNINWEGSRAQGLFAADHAALEQAIVTPAGADPLLAGLTAPAADSNVPVTAAAAVPAAVVPVADLLTDLAEPAVEAVADPLAGLV
tara:strand:- start:259 stop:1224 length:966 start_codon:yes stop_codon:yes gene_type:complete